MTLTEGYLSQFRTCLSLSGLIHEVFMWSPNFHVEIRSFILKFFCEIRCNHIWLPRPDTKPVPLFVFMRCIIYKYACVVIRWYITLLAQTPNRAYGKKSRKSKVAQREGAGKKMLCVYANDASSVHFHPFRSTHHPNWPSLARCIIEQRNLFPFHWSALEKNDSVPSRDGFFGFFASEWGKTALKSEL